MAGFEDIKDILLRSFLPVVPTSNWRSRFVVLKYPLLQPLTKLIKHYRNTGRRNCIHMTSLFEVWSQIKSASERSSVGLIRLAAYSRPDLSSCVENRKITRRLKIDSSDFCIFSYLYIHFWYYQIIVITVIFSFVIPVSSSSLYFTCFDWL